MTSPGGQTRPIEILTPDEVRQLIRACSAKAPTGIRNRALISLLYRSGLRIGEWKQTEPTDPVIPQSLPELSNQKKKDIQNKLKNISISPPEILFVCKIWTKIYF